MSTARNVGSLIYRRTIEEMNLELTKVIKDFER